MSLERILEVLELSSDKGIDLAEHTKDFTGPLRETYRTLHSKKEHNSLHINLI